MTILMLRSQLYPGNSLGPAAPGNINIFLHLLFEEVHLTVSYVLKTIFETDTLISSSLRYSSPFMTC